MIISETGHLRHTLRSSSRRLCRLGSAQRVIVSDQFASGSFSTDHVPGRSATPSDLDDVFQLSLPNLRLRQIEPPPLDDLLGLLQFLDLSLACGDELRVLLSSTLVLLLLLPFVVLVL